MATSSDLSAFGLRPSPFTREIDEADLWLPESKAALLLAELSFTTVPSTLLLGEPRRARDDDEEDDDGDLF